MTILYVARQANVTACHGNHVGGQGTKDGHALIGHILRLQDVLVQVLVAMHTQVSTRTHAVSLCDVPAFFGGQAASLAVVVVHVPVVGELFIFVAKSARALKRVKESHGKVQVLLV